jgi:hypothetical protein
MTDARKQTAGGRKSWWSQARGTAGRAVATMVIVIGLVGGIGSPAQAVQLIPSGKPGSTSLPTATFTVQPQQFLNNYYLNSLGRTVYESPNYKTYDQRVCVTHDFYRYVVVSLYGPPVPYWTKDGTVTQCGVIPAANSSIYDGGAHNLLTNLLQGGYAVVVTVTWSFTNGSFIGSRIYDYDSPSDYACYTPCTAGWASDGDVWVRPT